MMTNQEKSMKRFRWLRDNREIIITVLSAWILFRILMICIAWFIQYFPFATGAYGESVVRREFGATPIWLLDMNARWSAVPILSEVQKSPNAPEIDRALQAAYPVYPLYPLLIRAANAVLPASMASRMSVTILVGIILSNFFFLFAMFGLHALASHLFDSKVAQKAILLSFCLPGAFLFMVVGAESLFLCLAIFACLFAERGKWIAASLLGTLASLTLSAGFLLFFLLGAIAIQQKSNASRSFSAQVFALLLIPTALGIYWGKTSSIGSVLSAIAPSSIRALGTQNTHIHAVHAGLLLFFGIVLLSMLLQSQQKRYAIYGLLWIVSVILEKCSASPLQAVTLSFPAILWISASLKKDSTDNAVLIFLCSFFCVIQILFFRGWITYFWVG